MGPRVGRENLLLCHKHLLCCVPHLPAQPAASGKATGCAASTHWHGHQNSLSHQAQGPSLCYSLWFTYCHHCQFSCYHQTYPGAADFACLLSQLLPHLHAHFPATRTRVTAGNLSLMRVGTTTQSKSLAPAVTGSQCPFAVFKQRR